MERSPVSLPCDVAPPTLHGRVHQGACWLWSGSVILLFPFKMGVSCVRVTLPYVPSWPGAGGRATLGPGGACLAGPSKCWQPPVSACPGHPGPHPRRGRWRRSLCPWSLPLPQACPTPSCKAPVALCCWSYPGPGPSSQPELALGLDQRFPAHLLAPLLPQTRLSLVATEHEHLLKPQGPHLSGVRSTLFGTVLCTVPHPPCDLAVAF